MASEVDLLARTVMGHRLRPGYFLITPKRWAVKPAVDSPLGRETI
jgi:hypothetical protein